MDDLKKIIKKERKRFSARKREIREEVKDEFLEIVEERVESFREYLKGWCGERREEGGEEEEAEA